MKNFLFGIICGGLFLGLFLALSSQSLNQNNTEVLATSEEVKPTGASVESRPTDQSVKSRSKYATWWTSVERAEASLWPDLEQKGEPHDFLEKFNTQFFVSDDSAPDLAQLREQDQKLSAMFDAVVNGFGQVDTWTCDWENFQTLDDAAALKEQVTKKSLAWVSLLNGFSLYPHTEEPTAEGDLNPWKKLKRIVEQCTNPSTSPDTEEQHFGVGELLACGIKDCCNGGYCSFNCPGLTSPQCGNRENGRCCGLRPNLGPSSRTIPVWVPGARNCRAVPDETDFPDPITPPSLANCRWLNSVAEYNAERSHHPELERIERVDLGRDVAIFSCGPEDGPRQLSIVAHRYCHPESPNFRVKNNYVLCDPRTN